MAASMGTKKAVKKTALTGKQKKRSARPKQSFSIYIYKVLKQVHPDTGITTWEKVVRRLLGAGVLGDSFGALRHGVLGQLAGQQETHGGLNLPAADGRPLIVVCKTRRLGGDPLENVVHERVHDAHSLARNSGVRVHLFQHFVNVDAKTLLAACAALLSLVGRRSLLDSFLGSFAGSHCCLYLFFTSQEILFNNRDIYGF